MDGFGIEGNRKSREEEADEDEADVGPMKPNGSSKDQDKDHDTLFKSDAKLQSEPHGGNDLTSAAEFTCTKVPEQPFTPIASPRTPTERDVINLHADQADWLPMETQWMFT